MLIKLCHLPYGGSAYLNPFSYAIKFYNKVPQLLLLVEQIHMGMDNLTKFIHQTVHTELDYSLQDSQDRDKGILSLDILGNILSGRELQEKIDNLIFLYAYESTACSWLA